MNSKYVWDQLFEITIPSDWNCTEEEGLITFYNSECGVGALQISFLKRTLEENPSEKDVIDLALFFANGRGWDIDIKNVKTKVISNSHCSVFEFIEKDNDELTYWQVWNIINRRRAATITYLCDSSALNQEREIRESIVNSFSWL